MLMQETIKKSTLLEARIQAFLEKDGCTQGWGDSFLVAPHAEGLFGITEEGDTIETLPPVHVMENPNFARWFGGSKVVDSEGNPLVVYHGTNRSFREFSSFGQKTRNVTAYIGAWFTTSKSVAEKFTKNYETEQEYPDGSNILPCYLSIQNPCYFHKDDLQSYKSIEVVGNLLRTMRELLENIGTDTYDKVVNIFYDLSNKSRVDFGVLMLKSYVYNEKYFKEHYKELAKLIDEAIIDNDDLIASGIQDDPWWNMYDILTRFKTSSDKKMADDFVVYLKQNGYDGIILNGTKMDSPNKNTVQFIAFDSNQIKSIYNNGQFSTATDNISEEEIDENITGDAGFIQGHMYEGNPLDEESSGMGERYAPNTAYTFWQN